MTDTQQDHPTPPDAAHRLDDLFTTIRGALAQDAGADARSAGALACRAILGILDPTSRAAPTAAPTSPAPSVSPFAAALGALGSPNSPITAALGALGSVPREQILQFVVGLRSLLTQRGPTYLARPAPSPLAGRTTGTDPPVPAERSTSRANGKRA